MISKKDRKIIADVEDTDEPIIVFRAKDGLAAELLVVYSEMAGNAGCSPEFVEAVDERRRQFVTWGVGHPHEMKVPD